MDPIYSVDGTPMCNWHRGTVATNVCGCSDNGYGTGRDRYACKLCSDVCASPGRAIQPSDFAPSALTTPEPSSSVTVDPSASSEASLLMNPPAIFTKTESETEMSVATEPAFPLTDAPAVDDFDVTLWTKGDVVKSQGGKFGVVYAELKDYADKRIGSVVVTDNDKLYLYGSDINTVWSKTLDNPSQGLLRKVFDAGVVLEERIAEYVREGNDVDTYKEKVKAKVIEEATSRNWCSEAADFLESIGIDPSVSYRVTGYFTTYVHGRIGDSYNGLDEDAVFEAMSSDDITVDTTELDTDY